MSSVTVSGNASGTGIFTIASPNSNTNRTLNLPDATGTVQVSGNPISGTTGSFSGNLTLGSSTLATPTGSAPSYLCRAWVNFNGTGTVAIRASGNVSSITDNGNGDYTVNFTTAMSDSDYCVSNYSASNATNWFLGRVVSYSTTAYRFVTVDNSGTLTDTAFGNVAIFR